MKSSTRSQLLQLLSVSAVMSEKGTTAHSFTLDDAPQGNTAFSRLSEQAKELIVNIVMGIPMPSPADIPEKVREEIIKWTETEE